jgi:hypothetical protein
LRPKALGLYKNEDEYRANLIIPFPAIIDAVEIDPISKSKKYCMQIISEEKNFRFCASDEDSLAKWLGAFKSLLVKRKEASFQRAMQSGTNTATVLPSSSNSNAPHTPHATQKLAVPNLASAQASQT